MSKTIGHLRQPLPRASRVKLEAFISEILRRGEWSTAKRNQIADKFEVTDRTVEKARDRVMQRWAAECDTTGAREDRTRTFLARLDYDIEAARKVDPKAPVIGMLRKLEAEVLGIGGKVRIEHTGAISVDITDAIRTEVARLTDADLEAAAKKIGTE